MPWRPRATTAAAASSDTGSSPAAGCSAAPTAPRSPAWRAPRTGSRADGLREAAPGGAEERQEGAEGSSSEEDDLEALGQDQERARAGGHQGRRPEARSIEGHRQRRRRHDRHGAAARGREARHRGPVEDGQGSADPGGRPEAPVALVRAASGAAAAGVGAEVAHEEGEDHHEDLEAGHLVGARAPHQPVGQRRPRQDEEAQERQDPAVEGVAQQVAEDEDEEQRQARRYQREQGGEATHGRELTPFGPVTGARMTDYSALKAIYINCTLKRSPEQSQPQGLAPRSIAIMQENGVE